MMCKYCYFPILQTGKRLGDIQWPIQGPTSSELQVQAQTPGMSPVKNTLFTTMIPCPEALLYQMWPVEFGAINVEEITATGCIGIAILSTEALGSRARELCSNHLLAMCVHVFEIWEAHFFEKRQKHWNQAF